MNEVQCIFEFKHIQRNVFIYAIIIEKLAINTQLLAN